MDVNEKKEEIAQSHEWLLETVYGSNELEISWCRTFGNLSLLQHKEEGCEVNRIVVETRASLQSGLTAGQSCYARESAETSTLFEN